jgi:parallel beta-helix repeat protein
LEQIGADLPIPLYDGVAAMNSTCVEFSHNRIRNIFNAITVDGDQVGDRGHYFRVSYNQIDDFAGDGIDHSASDALIAHNQITNSHDVCNQKCIHTDGIQGWNHNNQAGIVNYNVEIISNKIVYRTKSPYPVPNGGLQGITIFDGFWKNVKIANNTVVTNHWHGITIGGVDGLVVENNTVLSVNDRQTWIRVGGETHEGGRSRDVVVRNNIAMQFIAPPPGVPGYVEDHNLSVMDPRSVATRFDASAFDFDLHLRATSEAVGRGASDPRVPVDQEGRARGKSVDMGAFQISP